jgi:hypothetical protein
VSEEHPAMSIDDANHGRRKFLANAIAAAIGFGAWPFGRSADVFPRRGSMQAEAPAVHGMLLFGDKRLYLSHLPLFSMPAHRYQLLLEATLTKADTNPQAAYVNDRHAHPDISIYTFEPSPFVLPELDPKDQKRKAFTGRTVRGHFERTGNVQIDDGVTATVIRVVHFQAFAKAPDPLADLQYILFGEPEDAFVSHVITKPPDFDHVLSVRLVDHTFSAGELSRGVRLRFPGRANTVAERLLAEGPVTAEVVAPGRDIAQVQIQRRAEIYFEENELRSA